MSQNKFSKSSSCCCLDKISKKNDRTLLVYISSRLSNICQEVEELGYHTFFPKRDTVPLEKKLVQQDESKRIASRIVFEYNMYNMYLADVLLADASCDIVADCIFALSLGLNIIIFNIYNVNFSKLKPIFTNVDVKKIKFVVSVEDIYKSLLEVSQVKKCASIPESIKDIIDTGKIHKKVFNLS